jgi:hypothetical protein
MNLKRIAALTLAYGLAGTATLDARLDASTDMFASDFSTATVVVDDAPEVSSESNFAVLAAQPSNRPTQPKSQTIPSRPAVPRNGPAPGSLPPAARSTVPSPSSTPPMEPQPTPSSRQLTSNDFALEGATRSLGGAGSQPSVTPYMVGDFFSSGGQMFLAPLYIGGPEQILAELPNAGGSLRVKISENNSPIPRDRVFYAFNDFFNAIPTYSQGNLTSVMDVERHTPGFEKTFWDGLGSIELRTPVAYTQNSKVSLDGTGPLKDTEFGNIAVAAKFLAWRSDEWAWAIGTGVNIPTASDAEIYIDGQRQFTIKNESTHILPYVGFLWQPADLFYIQGFLQVDVAANGNTIEQQGTRVGVLTDQTLLYADISIGYWLFYNPEASFLMGITPTIEFHYTSTMQNADIVTAGSSLGAVGFGNVYNQLAITNVTAGAHFWFGPRSVFTFAGAFPLSTREQDRMFDAEFIAQFNRFF